MNLYLIEFYTVDGDINFAWVKACNREAALKALGLNVTFSECIQITEQNKIVKLLGVDKPVYLQARRRS